MSRLLLCSSKLGSEQSAAILRFDKNVSASHPVPSQGGATGNAPAEAQDRLASSSRQFPYSNLDRRMDFPPASIPNTYTPLGNPDRSEVQD